jgi:hypothetical protein
MKRNAVIFMEKRSVAIAILLVITSTIFISVASAATTTYDYSSGADTDKWAWEVDSNDDPPTSINTETALSTAQYVSIGTLDSNRWQTIDPGGNDYISMKSTIDIQESAASIKNILFHVVGYKSGAQSQRVNIHGYNKNTLLWDLIGFGDIPTSSDGTVEASLTANFNNYIDADGKMTWCFILTRRDRWLYVNYVKVEVTHTSISGVATDESTYKVGETITTTWTSADGFGSGEDCINVEYWDVTAGKQFNLTSQDATSAPPSTSKALTGSEIGHEIDVYVYTTSSSSGDRSTAITPGDPWPYSIPNPVQGPIITSCNSAGTEINEFAPGENVSVKATGLEASTAYKIWLQDSQVNEGDSLIVGENPSSAETPKEVTTDGSGNFVATLIWAIPSDAPVTHHEYDIVVDNQDSGTVGTYNASVYFVYGRRGKGNSQ